MTQVDFYILAEAAPHSRERYACRVVEKAHQLGRRVYIHTGSAEHSARVDELLWTFKPGSFLPHTRYPADLEPQAPILIGHDSAPPVEAEVLINLAAEVPLFFSRFERVVELVDASEEHRQSGRARFRFYRDRGYPLASHDIDPSKVKP